MPEEPSITTPEHKTSITRIHALKTFLSLLLIEKTYGIRSSKKISKDYRFSTKLMLGGLLIFLISCSIAVIIPPFTLVAYVGAIVLIVGLCIKIVAQGVREAHKYP